MTMTVMKNMMTTVIARIPLAAIRDMAAGIPLAEIQAAGEETDRRQANGTHQWRALLVFFVVFIKIEQLKKMNPHMPCPKNGHQDRGKCIH